MLFGNTRKKEVQSNVKKKQTRQHRRSIVVVLVTSTVIIFYPLFISLQLIFVGIIGRGLVFSGTSGPPSSLEVRHGQPTNLEVFPEMFCNEGQRAEPSLFSPQVLAKHLSANFEVPFCCGPPQGNGKVLLVQLGALDRGWADSQAVDQNSVEALQKKKKKRKEE